MPEESQVVASAANAVAERSVWGMQSTARSLIAYAEWVHNTTFELGSAILPWAVESLGQVVSRLKRCVSDGKNGVRASEAEESPQGVFSVGRGGDVHAD